MSLIPSIRSVGLRTIGLSTATSSGAAVSGIKANKSVRRSILSPQCQLLQINSASMFSRATREDWPKPKPWPYEEKGYNCVTAWFEGTLKRFDENTKVVVIDGPPGVGKDALGKYIADEFDLKYFPSTTMDQYYINGYGFDFRTWDDKLPKSVKCYDEKTFIKNPKDKYKRLLCMEIEKLKLAFSQYVDAMVHIFNTGQGVLLTKHPYSHFTFIEAHARAGYLDKKELGAYLKHRDETIHHLLKPHLVVYLDCPVPIVLDKLKARGQGEEKALNAEFLKGLEEAYKTKFLRDIEVNSELLVYDWSEPGDFEVVAEDIERINFEEKREPRHPKFKDWQFVDDTAACQERWKFTQRKLTLLQDFVVPINDVPSLFADPDDIDKYWDLFVSAPGNRYTYGYNPEMGDNVLLKTKNPYPSVDKPMPPF